MLFVHFLNSNGTLRPGFRVAGVIPSIFGKHGIKPRKGMEKIIYSLMQESSVKHCPSYVPLITKKRFLGEAHFSSPQDDTVVQGHKL